MPAHIHLYFKLENGFIYYINDFVFADDPLVTAGYINDLNNPHNPKEIDNGVVTLSKQENNFIGNRDILISE